VALTQLGDVCTIAKTLVETLNDVLQNLDATGSVDSSPVYAGRAQTLAKFFYDRNDHGRGSMFEWTWRSQIPCLDGKNRFHVWMDLELRAHLCQFLCPWSTAVPKEEPSLALFPPPPAGAEVPIPAAPACVRRATKRA